MACVSGSNIVNDGLVFHFDMENGVKSWKGAPTSNLAVGKFFDGNGNFTIDENITDTMPDGSIGTARLLNAQIVVDPNRTVSIGSYSLTAGSTYTLSFYVMNIDCTGFGGNLFSPTLGRVIGSIVYPAVSTTEWTKVVTTFTVPNEGFNPVTLSPQAFRDGGIGRFKMCWLQMEQGTFPTRFVNGTRSDIEALVDISKGGNTITPSSITYSSDGEFNFASGNYLSASTGITGSQYTVLMWHYNSASSFQFVGHRTFMSSSNFRFQWDDNSSTTGRGPFVDFSSAVGGGQAMFGASLTPSNFASGTYNMVGMVSDGSTVKTILNNVTTGQSTVISSSRPFSSNGNIQIGNDGLSGIGGADNINRDLGIVKIPKVLVYNRALTDAEIKQNFESMRSRYGI